MDKETKEYDNSDTKLDYFSLKRISCNSFEWLVIPSFNHSGKGMVLNEDQMKFVHTILFSYSKDISTPIIKKYLESLGYII